VVALDLLGMGFSERVDGLAYGFSTSGAGRSST
jgi:hypothetical protein